MREDDHLRAVDGVCVGFGSGLLCASSPSDGHTRRDVAYNADYTLQLCMAGLVAYLMTKRDETMRQLVDVGLDATAVRVKEVACHQNAVLPWSWIAACTPVAAALIATWKL